MTAIIIISVTLGLCYIVLMLLYRLGWHLQPVFTIPGNFNPVTYISVIIPARNEQNNIENCINSILAGSYPKQLFEVIVVDDHSTDNTAARVKAYNLPAIRCISLADYLSNTVNLVAFKKKALNTGISQSRGELIVTTDADCIAPPDWLKIIAAKYEQENPVMIVGPVDFTTDNSIIQVFQSLDFMSMQGITAASQRLQLGNMSNGANLCFKREAFDAVNGYEGIDHIASGDDYLLMTKLNKKYPGKIAYIKSGDVIVKTPPQPDWQSFIQQRIRWASKSAKYDDKKLNTILVFAYLFNLSFLFLFISCFFHPIFCIITVSLMIVKVTADFIFVYPVSAFFHKRSQLPAFILLQPLHIMYIIVAGLLGFVGVYSWKGRKVK